MGHSYGLLTSCGNPIVYEHHGTFLCFINCMGHSYGFIHFIGHSYGLLTSSENSMLYSIMGHSYGLLNSWEVPMAY